MESAAASAGSRGDDPIAGGPGLRHPHGRVPRHQYRARAPLRGTPPRPRDRLACGPAAPGVLRAAASPCSSSVLAIAVAWVLRAPPPHLPAAAPAAPVPGRPNVLLIVLDTVRADHLSLYGYRRRTSPNLDALAADSLVFDRARANATYSLASHASLFTGLLPSRHGARPIPRSWFERHPTLNLAAQHFRVRNDVPTLAQDLKTLGYSTAGISANDVYLAPWTGLQRGFDAFEAKARRRYRFFPLSAPFVARILPRLGVSPGQVLRGHVAGSRHHRRRRSAGCRPHPTPFFLFLNYFDAHAPYDPPGGGPFRGDGIGRDGDVADYDGEIAFLDAHLGRLFQFMRDRGLLERTLVIVTADHGEYFGEHGLGGGHPPVLYEPVLSVPLIVRLPGGGSSGRVRRWTGLHEVRGLVREVLAGKAPLSILEERDAPVALAEAWAGAASRSRALFGRGLLRRLQAARKPLGPRRAVRPGRRSRREPATSCRRLRRRPPRHTRGCGRRWRSAPRLAWESHPRPLPKPSSACGRWATCSEARYPGRLRPACTRRCSTPGSPSSFLRRPSTVGHRCR